jgi:hypothetical protein
MPGAWQRLSSLFIRYDPAFILERPDERPSYIDQMGGIFCEHSILRLSDGWVESPSESLSLLGLDAPDDRIIIGERTRHRLIEDKWPEEERVSVVKAGQAEGLWDRLDVQDGHPPFIRVNGVQIEDYLDVRLPNNHLVIANDPYSCETSGARWLALNPAVGKALGWRPAPGRWFRWQDQAGNLVVESVWWNDGPMQQFAERLHTVVGGGWLVLVTKSGFEEIERAAGQLSRGGVVWRSMGWHGDIARYHARSVLALA